MSENSGGSSKRTRGLSAKTRRANTKAGRASAKSGGGERKDQGVERKVWASERSGDTTADSVCTGSLNIAVLLGFTRFYSPKTVRDSLRLSSKTFRLSCDCDSLRSSVTACRI